MSAMPSMPAMRLADVMPGVSPSDLVHVTGAAAGIAVVTTLVGVVVLKALSRQSMGKQLMMIVIVTLVTSLASCGVIAIWMIDDVTDREIILELLSVAGLAGI